MNQSELVLITILFFVSFSCVVCKQQNFRTRSFPENFKTPALHENKGNQTHRDMCQSPNLKWLVLYLQKEENDQDQILKWSSKGVDIENIATVTRNGKIKLNTSGLFQLSIVLTINTYVDGFRCLNGKKVARLQIECFKNDKLKFYLPSTVHEDDQRSVSFPVLPIQIDKGDEIYIKVTKRGCIYPQEETGVLTLIWVSCP